jgi:2-iminobutanoate/2-iminopropanoate deaminase
MENSEGSETMGKQIISTSKAPKPVGPYSQAVRAGDLIFIAGQIAIDPKAGTLIQGDIKDQTKRVLENVKAILEAASLSMGDVVKTTVFLKNIADFPKMNEVYGTYFGSGSPARTTAQVANLPSGAEVEIEVVAYAPE